MNYFINLPIDILRNIYSMDNTCKTIFTNDIIKSYSILDSYNENFIENLNDKKIKCIYNFIFKNCEIFGDLENNNKFRHDLYSINFSMTSGGTDYFDIYKHISPNSFEKIKIISVGIRSSIIKYDYKFKYNYYDGCFYLSVNLGYSLPMHYNKYQLYKYKEGTYKI